MKKHPRNAATGRNAAAAPAPKHSTPQPAAPCPAPVESETDRIAALVESPAATRLLLARKSRAAQDEFAGAAFRFILDGITPPPEVISPEELNTIRAELKNPPPVETPPPPQFDFSPRESDTVPDALPELPARGWIQADSFEAYDETPDGDAIADTFGAARDFIPWKRAVLRFPLYYRATGLFYKDGKPFALYEFTPEPFAAERGHCSPDSFLLARPLESLESEPRPVAV